MSQQRFVVLGVAHVRSGWFTEVARWSTSGTVPVEFVKCLSAAELLAHADSGRAFSAALLDATLPTVDRDLIHHLARRHIPAFVVAGAVPARNWAELGAAAELPAHLAPAHLLDALTAEAEPIHPTTAALGAPIATVDDLGAEPPERCPLVAVLGRSGAGASTIAMALAQDLADRTSADPTAIGPWPTDAGTGTSTGPRPVVLADLALHAHLALLHDAGDVVPGLPELVEAHRDGTPTPDAVLDTTYLVPMRRYRLLLGLRRHAGWTTLPARSLRAAVDGLRSAAGVVVADVDADLEGESDTGSFDVEDRNRLARTAVQHADVVVAVCQPHAVGLHGLVVLLGDLRSAGVDPHRVLVVVNRAPRLPRRRSDLARTLAALAAAAAATTADGTDADAAAYGALAFIPERRGLDDVHLAVTRLPPAIAVPVGRAVAELVARGPAADRAGSPSARADQGPVPIRAGELGHWTRDDPG